ncbi:Spo0E family sporulation regulatory protein-aspartic acid phosphatase [Garciella nitratireducens]|uniref:Spo0E family sporulation regulatory protein-aspartic acid phosphatase n=1 Tax=Garciella nitratireducens TaxID=218205 RepID=UPI000DEAACCC|nr:Spo0E family sporulation regulatory protein-aspartic acid phosphatase [Garciella nitratireducens]RBP42206.1 Spo0E like sporulation regulatory protein [Garciella nitratireducens]
MDYLEKIKKNKELLYDLLENDSSNSNEIYDQSCVLDKLILQYMRSEAEYNIHKKSS